MLAAGRAQVHSASERTAVKRAVLAALDGLRTASGGYLEALEEYGGQFNGEPDTVMAALRGRAPAVLVAIGDDSADIKGMGRRRMMMDLNLEVFVVSAHLRSPEARLSGDEAGALGTGDPGIDVMLADVRTLLAGADLGAPGVDRPTLKGASQMIADPSLAMFRQDYSVRCAVVVAPPAASPVREIESAEHRHNLEDAATENPVASGVSTPDE